MKFIRYSFAGFLLSVLVSQSMMDAFSVILSIAWIIYYWQQKKANLSLPFLRKIGLEYVWIFWFVVVSLGFLIHPIDPPYGFSRVVEFKWVLLLYVFIETLSLLQPNRKVLTFLLSFLLVIGLANMFFFIFDWPILKNWRYGAYEDGGVRAAGIFVNPMTFAHSFVIFVTFLMGIVFFDLKNWSRLQRIVALITLIICSVGLYYTYTRGVWIGWATAIVLGAFLLKPKFGFSALLALSIFFVASYYGSEHFRDKIEQTRREFAGESERKHLWRTHFYIFQENPIFGLGYGQNTRQLPEYYKKLGVPDGTIQSHAHNQYIHLLAGTGILGFLGYVIIWAFFLLQLWKLWRCVSLDEWDRGVVFGILMGSLAFIVGGLTEANFEHSKVRFAVLIIWAYIVVLARKYNVLGWKVRI